MAFVLAVAIAFAIGGSQNPRILYVILLFALCSTSIIDLDGLNGRYALLGIFLFSYFVMYGAGDCSALLQGTTTDKSTAALSTTEAIVLVGGAIVILIYRLVVLINSAIAKAQVARDWPARAIFLAGFLMWAIGTYATYVWYVHIITDTTNEALRKGLQSISTYAASAYILAQMLQPLGILLIAYAWRGYRLGFLVVPLLGVVVVQVILGFIIDIKGTAMLGGILVIVTIVLMDGRLPKLWLAGAVAYVILVFPIFQAYRAEIHGTRGVARTTVVENLGKTLNLALSAENRVNSGRDRAQTFLERSSLLGSVQLIVEKTGNAVPFQHGHTLTPILATFLPKIVWSDKPDVPTGQVMNKEFHVTDSEDVYISPSHLGELYWNFGWLGVLVGMTAIGGILGFVGSRFNLADAKTVTRLLITVVTIKQVVMSFEGVIAASYVVWLRSLAGIGLLHVIFARIPVRLRGRGTEHEESRMPAIGPIGVKSFSNLMS